MQQEEIAAVVNLVPHSKEGTICLYPGKSCNNPRVAKSNGQLHKFCHFHRDKANLNQRRLEFKRQNQQEHEESGATQTAPLQVRGPPLLPKSTISEHVDDSDEEFELDEEHIRLIEEVAAANISPQN